MRRFLLLVLALLVALASFLGWALILIQPEDSPRSRPLLIQTLPAETTVPETLPPETTIPETTAVETTAPETQPEETQNFFYVPQYYQTDYPYVHFGNGTVATSGCSITCLAMVATYMADQTYTPAELAFHFADYGKNNIERLDNALAEMQLPYTRAENVVEVLDAVRHGKVAIVMVDGESVFTTGQHFIVVAGTTQDGKFIVYDPLREHYLYCEPHVKDGYDNGFADFYLMRGYCGGWIFDKAEMSEDSFRYDASLPDQRKHRYDGYILNEDDIYTLACFILAEARYESAEVQQAVAEVVLNRLITPGYPNTVSEIIQYTELSRASGAMAKVEEVGMEQYLAVDAAMYGPYVLSEDICFYTASEEGTGECGQLGSFTFYLSK